MICAIGELLIDFIQTEENEFSFPVLSAMPGGAPANFLSAVKSEGIDACFIGKVGDDAFGALLTQELRRCGIDTAGVVRDKGVFTTLAFVTLDAGGDRSFSFARKPGADTCLRYEDIDLSLIDACSIFHFGSLSFTSEPSRSAVTRALEYAKGKGKLISYDPNYRPSLWEDEETARKQIKNGFSFSDIVKLSYEEGQFLFGEGEEKTADILISEYGCSLVFVTLGEKGCYYRNKNGGGFTKSEKDVSAIDTTGAGDIFGGTAAAAVLKSGKHPRELTKSELHEIATKGCTKATLSTLRHGGRV